MARTIQQSIEFEGVTAEELFETYVDSDKHAAAIGAPVTMTAEIGAEFMAFGKDRVSGRNLLILPRRTIVQTWRAQPWKESDPDSVLVLMFSAIPRGGRIELVQVQVPDHAYEIIDQGWIRMYWEPWRVYLRTEGTQPDTSDSHRIM